MVVFLARSFLVSFGSRRISYSCNIGLLIIGMSLISDRQRALFHCLFCVFVASVVRSFARLFVRWFVCLFGRSCLIRFTLHYCCVRAAFGFIFIFCFENGLEMFEFWTGQVSNKKKIKTRKSFREFRNPFSNIFGCPKTY